MRSGTFAAPTAAAGLVIMASAAAAARGLSSLTAQASCSPSVSERNAIAFVEEGRLNIRLACIAEPMIAPGRVPAIANYEPPLCCVSYHANCMAAAHCVRLECIQI